MASSAPYQFCLSASDDATVLFALDFALDGETDFPFEEYEFAYSVGGCGSSVLLTVGNGLTVDAPTMTFRIEKGVLPVGDYPHGLRATSTVTGDIVQIFDGTLTINEGNFP
ncbi:hypothetical protein [Microvirga yunnanensis]|uniref:hypothetical protein n=1 Tax=Microvirga yunnanensis TaxID=2953740 RepID=UPI0021CAB81D|nr:hypothetical protein [Microvirga sp. HBU65207]